MQTWKENVEQKFGHHAQRIAAYPKQVVALCLAILLIIASQLPKIEIDTDLANFLSKDTPVVKLYDATHKQYGNSDIILIGIETDDVFELEFLQKLTQLHQRLEQEVPWLDEVNSLINARVTSGEDNQLNVDDLMPEVPQSMTEIERIKRDVSQSPLIQAQQVSSDHTFTTVTVFPLSTDREEAFINSASTDDLLAAFDFDEAIENEATSSTAEALPQEKVNQILNVVKTIAAEFEDDDFMISIAGSSAVMSTLMTTMQTEMPKFVLLTMLGIVILLYSMFRRRSGVLTTMATVLTALLATFGLMAVTGTQIQLPMLLMPTMILSVTIGDAVHMLAIFFADLKKNQFSDKTASLEYAMRHCGLPMALTTLTTAAGLLSFVGGDVAAVSNLGLFSAIGVMLAFIFSMTLLPALLILVPIKAKQASQAPQQVSGIHKPDRIVPVLEWFADIGIKAPKTTVSIASLLLLLGVASAAQLKFSHDPLTWLPQGNDLVESTEILDRTMGGSIPIEIVIDTGIENGLHNPELLMAIEQALSELDRYQSEFVTLGNSISLIDIVKETHQALSHDQSYSIPKSRELLAQELLLFENNAPEDLERIVDSLFSQTRVTVMAPWMDALLYGDLNQEVQQIFEDAVGDKADIYVTGMLPMLGSTLDSVIVTMAESYITALVVIGIMMMLLLGSARDGALAMFPNILPIVMVMGLMIPLNIPLDLFTMLVASVAIGVAVDDTVHFMHHFKRNFVKSGNVQQAVHATITTAGRAMLTTGCVLAGGFFVFSLSTVQNIANFGLLACLTIVLAVLANFLLTPALMILAYRQKYDKNLNLSQEGTTHEQ